MRALLSTARIGQSDQFPGRTRRTESSAGPGGYTHFTPNRDVAVLILKPRPQK